ncbi:AAA family ATPase [bacterium]|nr:AAA family ATPase [bacterium]
MNSGFSMLKVKGFRRLRDTELRLNGLNVLIGANGVGKSSILEVLRLLAASANGRLQETISGMGGVGSLITHGEDSLRIEIELPVSDEPSMHYDLEIQKGGQAYAVGLERLLQHRRGSAQKPAKYIESNRHDIRYYEKNSSKVVRPTWQHQPFETSLAQVPKMFQVPEHFRQLLGSSTLYHVLDVSLRAPVRSPQQIRPITMPGVDGEDLLSCLYSLRESDRDRFDAITDTLEAAFSTFERVELPPAAAGLISLAWKDSNYKQPFFAHQLSEGTLRFLWLVTLLQSPDLPTVTMIDEPEVSLHPEMLRILAELMRESAQRTQLMVATHSDRLVRFLKPEELVVCDLDEKGGAAVTRANELDIENWLKDYSLDELWSLGRLGGRS